MLLSANLKEGAPDIPTFFHQKAEALRQQGWRVTFGVLDDRTSPKGLLRNYRRLKQEVEEHAPDVVHAKYGSTTAAMAHLVRGARPLVVSFVGDDLLGTPLPGLRWRLREWLARRIGWWAARHADAVFVRSENLLQALPVRLRAKASILPDGVALDLFRPLDKAVCRERLGWKPEAKVVLFNAGQGTNQVVKNPALARETVDLLAHADPAVSLHMMAGAGSEEVCWMLNAADCLLVTSLHEGAPKIVQEALACNLPVVSVPCGDVPERLEGVCPGGIGAYEAADLARLVRGVLEAGSRSNGRVRLIEQGLTTRQYAAKAGATYLTIRRS